MSQLLNTILETATDSALVALKTQQKLMEKKLNDQETINKDLYEKIFESGILGDGTSHVVISNITSVLTTSARSILGNENRELIHDYSGGRTDLISSMLPFNDMIRGRYNIIFAIFCF